MFLNGTLEKNSGFEHDLSLNQILGRNKGYERDSLNIILSDYHARSKKIAGQFVFINLFFEIDKQK